MLNDKEIRFLEENIANYKEMPLIDLIEKLEDYMQTRTSFNENDSTSKIIENILDRIGEK